MKKYLISFIIMLTFVMQSFAMLVQGIQRPVLLYLREAPWNDGIFTPTKSDPNVEPPVSVYLNEVSDSLLLYSPSEESVTYYIYDAYEQEVCNGNVSFSEQGEASIYVGTLGNGIYTIYIVVDDDVYGGEFQL